QSGPEPSAGDDLVRQRCAAHRSLAAFVLARELLSLVHADNELGRNALEDLAHIVPDACTCSTTLRTRTFFVGHCDRVFDAPQLVRKRPQRRPLVLLFLLLP